MKNLTLCSVAIAAAFVLAFGVASVADAQTYTSTTTSSATSSTTTFYPTATATTFPGTTVVATSSMSFQERSTVMNGMWPYLNARMDMSLGMTGAGVTALQNYLRVIDLLGANQYTVGVYDAATRNAVVNYQSVNHISATGYFGPYTQAHMVIALWLRAHGYVLY